MQTFLCLGLTLVLGAASARAMFIAPQDVPVDRLVRNAQAYLDKRPGDPEAHYTLARVHYLAFVAGRDSVSVYQPGGKGERPSLAGAQFAHDPGERKKRWAGKVSQKPLAAHAAAAVSGFHDALRLQPRFGLGQLGLGSALEEIVAWRDAVKPAGLPPELQSVTLHQARDAYTAALDLSKAEAAALKETPLGGFEGVVSHEAATALVRLAKESSAPLTAAERESVAKAERLLDRLKRLPPPGAITPIVFTFQPTEGLAGLLAPQRQVDFDLSGYGLPARWPWVKPELGFLVWDPRETGCVDSARQMFGSYTFQIPRRTGYDALAALDDNADGKLSGAELDGLSVWFDRDGDARSSPGEVTPLRKLGVESVAASATGFDGEHPTNACGLTLRGGRTLRTWDWIVTPLAAKK